MKASRLAAVIVASCMIPTLHGIPIPTEPRPALDQRVFADLSVCEQKCEIPCETLPTEVDSTLLYIHEVHVCRKLRSIESASSGLSTVLCVIIGVVALLVLYGCCHVYYWTSQHVPQWWKKRRMYRKQTDSNSTVPSTKSMSISSRDTIFIEERLSVEDKPVDAATAEDEDTRASDAQKYVSNV
ncbi:hypothetical protein AAVH_03560 [Aphelenchoides avenae]|nr:hypothetical protein AAVH_34238 [Aphelenchus avenae]KAH7729183.1 hypothetical protein AAVH_03560 [Aphelenchus avenae]